MNPTPNVIYRDWLGIHTGDVPPNHYQLLGCVNYEANVQTIVSAYAARTATLSGQLGEMQADIATGLLTELAAAQACLLDPQSKANYDAWLEQQITSSNAGGGINDEGDSEYRRPTPRSEAAVATPPAVLPAATAAAATASATMPRATGTAAQSLPSPVHRQHSKHRADEPTSALPWLIGGVCAGLLGVCVLAMVLFGGRDRRPVAGVNERNAGQVAAANSTTTDRSTNKSHRDGVVQNSRRNFRNNEHVAPPIDAPDRLTWDRDPDVAPGDVLDVENLDPRDDAAPSDGSDSTADTAEATPTETPVVHPVLRLAEVPKAVALPRRSTDEIASLAPAVLTRIEVDDARDVNLQLVSSQLAGGSGRFEVTPRDNPESTVRTWDVQHVADGAAPAPVGHYTLADGELSFAWSPDADAQTHAQLENQPLRITAGEEVATVVQREADEVAPIVVKVDAGAIGSTVPINNPPENADVVVAIEDLGEEFGEYTWEPSPTIEVGKSTTLRFGAEEDTFQLALQVSAEASGPNRLRIEARPMFRQTGTKRWDYFRPKQATQTLLALQQQQGLLDSQMQEIQRRFKRDPAARDQATAIHNQQSALLLERIANLQRISDRCQELQDKAELHFRVYAELGEEEIDLTRTKRGESATGDAAAEDAPADPNIGPPIEAADEADAEAAPLAGADAP